MALQIEKNMFLYFFLPFQVAYERMEKIGQSIGYQIRLESRVSPRTVLTYCTNGVLLRTLMAGDTSLTGGYCYMPSCSPRLLKRLCRFLR